MALVAVVVATAFGLSVAIGGASGSPRPSSFGGLAPTGPTEEATVVSVHDGDTIRVILDGENVPVRYIGIDAPEVGEDAEPFGDESTAANAEFVAGETVILERDVSETDRYGRLLRYVWLADDDGGWTLVNLELLRLGLARVVVFPPDVKYLDDLFRPAERGARDAGLGMWAGGG